jgi:Leucine-rich repeat (LRR) protein
MTLGKTQEDLFMTINRKWPFKWIALILLGVLLLFVILALYRTYLRPRQDSRRSNYDEFARTLEDLKSGRSTTLRDPDPTFLADCARDPAAAANVREVTIAELTISRCKISDARFRALKLFPGIKKIRLDYIPEPVDAFLENIKGMASLEELSLHRSRVTPKGMDVINCFPHLSRLSIDGNTDLACFEILKSNPRIEAFELYDCRTTDTGLSFLRTLPQLRELTLELAPESTGVIDLRGLERLESLTVHSITMSDASMTGVEKMKQLNILDLSRSEITDVGLERLKGLRKLKQVDLRKTKVTDAAVAKLRKDLPKCNCLGP